MITTLVSRSEPKDLVDFYTLFAQIPTLVLEDVLLQAKRKETLFDDPPTAAYQIEEGIRFAKEHEGLIPPLKKALQLENFYKFYENLAMHLYRSIRPEQPTS